MIIGYEHIKMLYTEHNNFVNSLPKPRFFAALRIKDRNFQVMLGVKTNWSTGIGGTPFGKEQ